MALTPAVENGLESLILSPAQQQAMQDAIYGQMARDIQTKSGNAMQQSLENTFARGVGTSSAGNQLAPGGLSSITDWNAGQIENSRANALLNARVDAMKQVRDAQMAAMGQAASYLNQQQARAQQAQQFNKNLSAQKSMHNENML